MDQEITLCIFNISQMDMASRRFIGSARETERVYDSLRERSGRIVPI
jgi:effector-binding domain-containing protein